MKTFYDGFEHEKMLISNRSEVIPKVNGHIHTPWSFSAFRDVEQAFELAVKEDIKVLGVNDFYTVAGYDEFAKLAIKNRIFPLFNIEFMALSEGGQAKGERYNDPNNPGRIYFSGKGLSYPQNMDKTSAQKLIFLEKESNKQVAAMVGKLNLWLKELGEELAFSFEEIKSKYARTLVRERHVARAIREMSEKRYSAANIQKFYKRLFGGAELKSDSNDNAAVEDEIRKVLLKSGGKAFVPEDRRAFLSLDEVKKIIISAGGVPCYPLLLDDSNGGFTDFEKDKEEMLSELKKMKVGCVELIPRRNSFEILKEYVTFFHNNNFIVVFGTEHNTSKLNSMSVTCRGERALDNYLMQVGYKGACVLAAHQYLVLKGDEGFVSADSSPCLQKIDEMEALGDKIITLFTS